MAKSAQLKQLHKRIKFLENRLLPKERHDGNYTAIERDKTKSFLLLVHAEIESYFEAMVVAKVKSSLADFNSNGKLNHCLASILAFSGNEISYSNKPVSDTINIKYRVNKSVNHYLSQVNQNHGVKEKNIVDLFIPIGLRYSELDSTWLNTMEAFGGIRGNIAHSSAQVQNLLDRNTIRDMVNIQILPEIEVVENFVTKI
ncbi:HEPN domain-containing protein [Dyadobacter bucti]|uniref:HEPN domain-containing protein n=1 Tax=Dyadobacter bucti TaxID=2572203 RepID=UPI003F70B723